MMTQTKSAADIALLMLELLDMMAYQHPKRIGTTEVRAVLGIGARSAQRQLNRLQAVGLVKSDNYNPAGWTLTEKGARLLSHNVEISK